MILQVSTLTSENASLLKRMADMTKKYNDATLDNRNLIFAVETLRTKVRSLCCKLFYVIFLSFCFMLFREHRICIDKLQIQSHSTWLTCTHIRHTQIRCHVHTPYSYEHFERDGCRQILCFMKLFFVKQSICPASGMHTIPTLFSA